MLARLIVCLLALAALGGAACAAPTGAPQSSAAPTAAAKPAAQAPSGSTSAAPAAGAATQATPPERISIKYGYNPILAGAPMFVAEERGYFREEGIDIEYTPFDSAALMVAPLSAGQLDIIPAVPSPSQFNALARDINMRAIAAQSVSYTGLLLRKDLADSGQVRTLQDLRGRRVSFNVEGSPVDYTLRVALQKEGIRLDEVDVQRVVNTDLAAALANGGVDAGVVPEPLPTLIENRGVGVRFLDVQEIAGPQTASFLTIGPSMISRPEAHTVRFLSAYLRGLRDYLGAIRDKRIADPQTLEMVSKWTKIPVETIAQANTAGPDSSGRIDLEDLNRQQDFWEREGLVPVKADLSKFVDYKYLDAVNAQAR